MLKPFLFIEDIHDFFNQLFLKNTLETRQKTNV